VEEEIKEKKALQGSEMVSPSWTQGLLARSARQHVEWLASPRIAEGCIAAWFWHVGCPGIFLLRIPLPLDVSFENVFSRNEILTNTFPSTEILGWLPIIALFGG
jgi:hypothetical protein